MLRSTDLLSTTNLGIIKFHLFSGPKFTLFAELRGKLKENLFTCVAGESCVSF